MPIPTLIIPAGIAGNSRRIHLIKVGIAGNSHRIHLIKVGIAGKPRRIHLIPAVIARYGLFILIKCGVIRHIAAMMHPNGLPSRLPPYSFIPDLPFKENPDYVETALTHRCYPIPVVLPAPV